MSLRFFFVQNMKKCFPTEKRNKYTLFYKSKKHFYILADIILTVFYGIV